MLKGPGDLFFNSRVGEDIFGETYTARISEVDNANKYLLLKFLREYLQWHEKTHHFHPTYTQDKQRLAAYSYLKYAYAFGGFTFAGVIFNPNYTSKNSFYLRKFNVVFFALIGYNWGRKKQDYELTNLMLKMNDYFPLEVKRALSDKDYRHLALFDWQNPGRKLFDEATGKSLS